MKKITKIQKIILGSSLALLTLVPIVAVAATSCSNQSKKNNNADNKPQNPTAPTTDDQNVVSTNVNEINKVISDINQKTSLKQINEFVNADNILPLLSLTSSQAKLTNISTTNNKMVSFSVQLIDKKNQFSQEILKKSIKNVIISLNSITFNIPINPNMTENGTYVATTADQINGLISFVNQINSSEQISSQLNSQNVLKKLGLNENQGKVTIQSGAPVNYDSKNYQSKTIVVTLSNNNLFNSTLSSSFNNLHNEVNINKTDNVLTLTNIRTNIIDNKKINVTLDLNNFDTYLHKVENSYSLEEVTNDLSNNSIAKELKTNIGYLSINLQNNKSETTQNGVQSYDLTISPKTGCEFDDTKVQNWITTVEKNGSYKVSYNDKNQTISITNIKTNIYTKTTKLNDINSSLFKVNNINGLKDKINTLSKENKLVSTITEQITNEKLSSDAVLINQALMNSNSGLVLTFASKTQKEFETINVNLTPNNISSVFGDQPNTLKNQFSEIASIGKHSALITNSSLSKDKISLDKLGLTDNKNATISLDSLAQSKPIQQSFEQFLKSKDVYSDVQNEVLYTSMNDIEAINSLWGQVVSSANTFITSSLKFNTGSSNNLTGKLIIEISNETGKQQTIQANNPLLNNEDEVVVPKNGYVLIAYDFDGSKLSPDAYNNGEKWYLSYGFDGVKKTLLTNSQEQKLNTSTSSNIELFGPSNLIDVTLNGISNKPNYFDSKTQTIFNKYLDSLNKETIQSQIMQQDNAIWNFIKTSAKDVGDILTILGNNPTLGQFLNSLSSPIIDVVSQLTNNPGFAKVLGGILSDQPVLTYLKNNSTEISNIVKQLTEYLKNSGIVNKLIPNVSSSLNLLSTNGIQLQSNNFVLAANTSSSSNIGNDFLTVLKDYASTQHFKELLAWLMGQAKNIPSSILAKQSLLQILGKDIQPILSDLLAQTKSKDNSNAAWIFLNSINEMLTTIENSQSVKDIYDLKLFDILKKSEDTNAIVNFLDKGLKPFLQMVNPAAVANLTKVTNIMTKVFSLIPTLHLQAPELIFKSLAQIQVNNGSSPQTITWEQLFDKYISFTPKVNISSYNPKTHQITYTNELSFNFKDNVSLNLTDIKKQLSDLTVGVVTKALGIDLNKKIPGIVSKLLPVSKIEAIKLADLLPDTFTISKGDGANFALVNNGGYLIPTVSNNHVTWYTNNNMILNTNFKSTSNNAISQILDNVKGVIKNLLGGFLGGIASATIVPGLKSPIESFVNNYTSGSFTFNGGWVNQSGINNNPEIKGFSNNVQDLNYKLLHKDNFDKKALNTILKESKYTKDISTQISGMNGSYIYLNDPDLNTAVLNNLFENSSLSWITNKDLPNYLKPVVSVQYTTDKSLSLFGQSVVNIPGQYVVQVKLPFKVLVSNNNGGTWYFTNNLQYTIPYTMPNK